MERKRSVSSRPCFCTEKAPVLVPVCVYLPVPSASSANDERPVLKRRMRPNIKKLAAKAARKFAKISNQGKKANFQMFSKPSRSCLKRANTGRKNRKTSKLTSQQVQVQVNNSLDAEVKGIFFPCLHCRRFVSDHVNILMIHLKFCPSRPKKG